MPTYVALLRGILPTNPNMRNEKFRDVFEGLGFSNVRTVLASGNVVFESPSRSPKKLEDAIEKALAQRLGITSTTILRSRSQLQRLVDDKPFKQLEHTRDTRLNVTFLKKPSGAAGKFSHPRNDEDHQLVATYAGEICSVVDATGSNTPDLMLWLEKKFGREITTRTWNTVARILSVMESLTG